MIYDDFTAETKRTLNLATNCGCLILGCAARATTGRLPHCTYAVPVAHPSSLLRCADWARDWLILWPPNFDGLALKMINIMNIYETDWFTTGNHQRNLSGSISTSFFEPDPNCWWWKSGHNMFMPSCYVRGKGQEKQFTVSMELFAREYLRFFNEWNMWKPWWFYPFLEVSCEISHHPSPGHWCYMTVAHCGWKKPYQGRKFDPSHLEIMVSMSPVNYAGLALYFVALGISMVASYYMQRSPCRRAASWLLIAITWFYILRFTITYPQTSWYQEGGDGHPELARLMSRCQHQGTNIGFHSHAVIWQGWNICYSNHGEFPHVEI